MPTNEKRKSEFEEFNQVVDQVLSVSHLDLKAQLDQEKQSKKRKKSKKSSASREASDRA
jgi:hypothetical protein